MKTFRQFVGESTVSRVLKWIANKSNSPGVNTPPERPTPSARQTETLRDTGNRLKLFPNSNTHDWSKTAEQENKTKERTPAAAPAARPAPAPASQSPTAAVRPTSPAPQRTSLGIAIPKNLSSPGASAPTDTTPRGSLGSNPGPTVAPTTDVPLPRPRPTAAPSPTPAARPAPAPAAQPASTAPASDASGPMTRYEKGGSLEYADKHHVYESFEMFLRKNYTNK